MALLTREGYRVQPFKCGPDYIDTKFHTTVCGRPSINLDSFMASEGHIHELYARHAADADVCVVEGMMGMYDGYDRARGSSAEIAGLLHLPVVMVVDAQSTAYSMAPLLSGFINFRPEVRIAGVIFNRVGSASHYALLKEVCEDLGLPCLGYLPKRAELTKESRYLGLDYTGKEEQKDIELMAAIMEQYIDYKQLLEQTTLPLMEQKTDSLPAKRRKLHILVAQNKESFSFCYEEHLEILHRLGTVTFFNPEQNRPIPGRTDLLYLPGGYPEKHCPRLTNAHLAIESIRKYIDAGGRVLAECGGMAYISQGILLDNLAGFRTNEQKLMVGALPFQISTRKEDRQLTLGYRHFTYNGQLVRGHEFHYTQMVENPDEKLESAAQLYNAKGIRVDTPLFRYKNVIASYMHLYWGELDLLKLFEE